MKAFSEIIGQEKAIDFLKRVIGGDRIPHAYLFTGINGVGKSTTALALARTVNCTSDTTGDGCGRCITCRQLTSGNFPDIISIAPDGQNIKIEQIRELNRALNYKPVSGKYRITIIDRAEMMTEEAANSFLKTLEEPPPGNIIVLKVVDLRDLLPTIVSRCQRVPFNPLNRDTIKEYLVAHHNQDDNTAYLAAGIADGSLGKAIEICEEGFLDARRELIELILGLKDMPGKQAVELAFEYGKKYSKKTQDDQSDIDLHGVIGIWKTCLRDILLASVRGNYDMMENRDYRDRIAALAAKYDADKLIESFFLLEDCQRDLIRNPNSGLLMEKMLLELKTLNN
ncbi:MAG: DNA polymerase III subunit delta' [Deltaproteobacteria bacterium]|nr:DNA polymerase III subunit delta' [Deltaproteobacteria bacterium]